jgi:tetratricopeptide (TPR) repeat protein
MIGTSAFSDRTEFSVSTAFLLSRYHYRRGVEFGKQGDPYGAAAEFRDAKRLDPFYAEAHQSLADALIDQVNLGLNGQRLKEAIPELVHEYRETIRLKPNAEAHYGLGIGLMFTGDVDRAISEFREAVRLRPDYYEAFDHLCVALLGKGDLDGAIAARREKVRLRPGDIAELCQLGDLLKEKGDKKGAIVAYKEATLLDPENNRCQYDGLEH